MLKLTVGLLIIFMCGCVSKTTWYDNVNQCDNYEPSCDFLGARKECSYNDKGCKSCTCVQPENPNFKSR